MRNRQVREFPRRVPDVFLQGFQYRPDAFQARGDRAQSLRSRRKITFHQAVDGFAQKPDVVDGILRPGLEDVQVQEFRAYPATEDLGIDSIGIRQSFRVKRAQPFLEGLQSVDPSAMSSGRPIRKPGVVIVNSGRGRVRRTPLE